MNLLLFGIAAPLSGFLIDRFGPRKVMLGSLALLIAGVSGTIVMTQFWQFFLVWGVIVGLGAGGVGSVLTATVGNRWFIARRGLALGILGSASSTGQIIFLPLFMAMITYAGWRLGSMDLGQPHRIESPALGGIDLLKRLGKGVFLAHDQLAVGEVHQPHAEKLILMTDVEGVKDKKSSLLSTLKENQARKMIQDGIVGSGMGLPAGLCSFV